MVSTPQTGGTQTTGVHAVFQIFGPALSVSSSPLQARDVGVVSAVCRPSVPTAIHHRREGIVGAVRGRSLPTAMHHLFRPAISVSSARPADHRHSTPYTTVVTCRRHGARTTDIHRQTPHFSPPDTTSRAHDRQHPKGRKRTCVIPHRIRCPQGSSLHCCDSAEEALPAALAVITSRESSITGS